MLNPITESSARQVPVQNGILPGDSKSLRRLQISLYSQAAEQVTGDFFDFFRVSQSQWVLVMGDIAGKGALAAALAAEVRVVLRGYCFSADPEANQAAPLSLCPIQVVSFLNRHLYSTTAPESYGDPVPCHLRLQDKPTRFHKRRTRFSGSHSERGCRSAGDNWYVGGGF